MYVSSVDAVCAVVLTTVEKIPPVRIWFMQRLCVYTWPPAPCAGPPDCGYCSSAGSVYPAAPPTPPPAAAAGPSSAHGPASELPSWPPTPPAPAPTPWTLPPESHTEPHSHCSVRALLRAWSSGIPAPSVFV